MKYLNFNNLTICIVLFIVTFPVLQAQNKVDAQWKGVNGTQIPLPPNEHPRLYLRSHNIPELKERMKDSDLKQVWNTLMEMKEDRKPEDIPEVKKLAVLCRTKRSNRTF